MRDFAPHQQALELKELGFNEPCFGYYYTLNGKDWKFAEKSEYYRLDDEINIGGKFSLLAPLYQQAFRWFREKYGLWQTILQNTDVDWTYDILPINGIHDYSLIDVYKTYEEAELACLIKLIEITKTK
jgi:hypothetical protein